MEDQEYDEILSAAISGCIQRFTRIFGEQIQQAKATGSLEGIRFPEPANDIEREALRLFVEKLAEIIGVPVPDASTGRRRQPDS